jgi:hypothetical protein
MIGAVDNSNAMLRAHFFVTEFCALGIFIPKAGPFDPFFANQARTPKGD